MLTAYRRMEGTYPMSPPSGRGENSGFSALKGKTPSVFSPTTPYALLICNLRPDQGKGKAVTVFLNNKSSPSDHCKARYDSTTMLEVFISNP